MGQQRRSLLTRTLAVALFSASALCLPWPAAASDKPFSDVAEESLYFPHIEMLREMGILSGSSLLGQETETFQPHNILLRAELARLATLIRLWEAYAEAENWGQLEGMSLTQAMDGHLKDYYRCGGDSCQSIGGVPFLDVMEKDLNCAEKETGCQPWYTQFVYYAVRHGMLKGYQTPKGREFRPLEGATRMQALRLALVDDASVSVWQDGRFLQLADFLGSGAPQGRRCLSGLKPEHLGLGQVNELEQGNAMATLLLADDLGLFGPKCELFLESGRSTAEQRGGWLQALASRREAARWFSMTFGQAPSAAKAEPAKAVLAQALAEEALAPASLEEQGMSAGEWGEAGLSAEALAQAGYDPECAPLPDSALKKEFGLLPMDSGVIECQKRSQGYRLGDPINRAEAAKILFTLKLFSLYPDLSSEQREAVKAKANVERVSKNYSVSQYTGSYLDVTKEDWFSDYIATLTKWGILSGDGGAKTFRPGDPANHPEAIKMALGSYLSAGTLENGTTLQEWDEMTAQRQEEFLKENKEAILSLKSAFPGYQDAWYGPYMVSAQAYG